MKEKESNRLQILLRYTLVSLGIILVSVLIVVKAIDTTVVHAAEWNQKADSLLARTYYVQPLRGDILADDGSVLATNITAYDVTLDYRSSARYQDWLIESLDSLSDSLACYFPIRDAQGWRAHLAAPLAKKPEQRTQCHKLLQGVTKEDCDRLKTFPYFKRFEKKNRYAHGLVASPRQVRMMPYGPMARRSIGRCCLKPVPKFKGSWRHSDSTDILTGYSGLEAALDSLLTGKPGLASTVALTHGMGQWVDEPAQDGYTLRTTINIGMQDIVETELMAMLEKTQADWGTCVLMEVATGDIKAISNLERDPSGRYIEAMNHALRGVEPGSVMKAISMIIALEDGYAFPLDRVYPIGSIFSYAGGSPIKDTHSPAALPVSRFIEYSSNIGMTKLLAPRYSDSHLNDFRERLRDIGLLDTLGTGMLGERPPYIPTLNPKAGGRVSLSRMTYGYATQIPPLYTCAMYNAIANKGRFVRPRLVSEYITRDGRSLPQPVTYVRDSVCSQANAHILMDMLHSVVYGEGGTAKFLRNDIVCIVGKTGTCRIANEATRDPVTGALIPAPPGYKQGHFRLAFCGIFPYEDPKYTCMVLISHPNLPGFTGAATTSGAVVKGIAMKMYARGMLGTHSDYTAISNPGTLPVMYASNGNEAAPLAKQAISAGRIKQFATPKATPPGTVPDVRGLGMRDALARIEEAGYEINASGAGYAIEQTPAAGSPLPAGSRVSVVFTTR